MGRHRRRRGHARTGLIGASAALTVGAVAVGTGLLPGIGDGLNGVGTDDVRAQDQEAGAARPTPPGEKPERTPGTTTPETATEEESAEETAEPEGEESEEESAAPSAPEPSPAPESGPPAGETPEEEPPPAPPAPEPTTAPPPPSEDPEPSQDPGGTEAEAVLALVNEERSRAGCQPLALDPALGALAAAHSRDMAERGYFGHTDPDGTTPWDRAAAAGVGHLGGENIARGQQDAASVMAGWMASEGHRANILNCDFTTLGVGVHHADGGPWWTQNFGF
ncbi:CAP domain-containing protein [Streptomyces marincola]|uniref:SCP domain-containing protein n=1 Tax=Streptomyces marincola TaxID=2878388 RepID=A0A1W7CU40_9ACTN|nr:CAP domain-containing protein [Streptomyces marincola]ARQ68262.1 hypothetical protein CAG99_04855 [Streptomyces marincola]